MWLEEPDIESKPCDLQEDTETDVDCYSDQFLSFDELQDEEKDTQEPKGQFEDVTDKVIQAFTVKRRKALIDQEEYEEDLVNYEVSVKRLFHSCLQFCYPPGHDKYHSSGCLDRPNDSYNK